MLRFWLWETTRALFFFFFWDNLILLRLTWNPGNVAKDDIELLVLLPSHSKPNGWIRSLRYWDEFEFQTILNERFLEDDSIFKRTDRFVQRLPSSLPQQKRSLSQLRMRVDIR